MNLLNLFEDSNTPGLNYAEELAYQIFKVAPDLDATGAADEVLDYAFDLAVNDLGRKRAHSLFAYDEDFDGDLVTAYVDLQMNKSAEDRKQADHDRLATGTNEGVAEGQLDEFGGSGFPKTPNYKVGDSVMVKGYQGVGKIAYIKHREDVGVIIKEPAPLRVQTTIDKLIPKQGVAEGEVYDLEKEYGYEKPKAQPKRASVPPTRPSLHPEDTDFMDPVERRLRADQARVKAAWAAHNAKKDTNESRMSELDAEYQDYKKLSPREFYNMYRITKQAWLAKYKSMLPQQGVAEADKKKDDEPEVRDVALQRAISRAKADFPTAGTGIEALAKDFMRSQDQDSKSFDQLRQAERKQDQMLSQISKIDQEQEQEIQSLEQQNSTLASRLQQLQSVNSELEKKLASMSGRKAEKKSKTDSAPAPVATTTAAEPAKKVKAKSKNKPALQKSAMKSTAAQLAAPKADPMAAMSQRIQQGDSSVIDKVTGQKSLAFEPSDNVLEPTITQRDVNPKFAAAKANASDVDPRYYADIAKKVAGNPEQFKAAMSGVRENDEEEADYSDKYQDMVARVGQKAREQEKKKPVDIADLARRLAAIDASKKEK